MISEGLFSNYLRHNEINEYLDSLAKLHPELVKVSVCGQSYEGRAIKSIKISCINKKPENNDGLLNKEKIVRAKSFKPRRTNTLGKTRKKCKSEKGKIASTILIDGGIHGREWMSVATAVYCIHELIENFDKNRILLQNLEFIIVPIINVDGYEYSHTNVGKFFELKTLPFWRKNRKPQSNCNSIGTDCNRNFDHHWNECPRMSRKNTYPGEAPFSEPETQLLKILMHSLMPNCKFYLSLHSHAKAFMYPWGYTKKPPKNWRQLHKLASIGQTAIKEKTGHIYRCGSVATLSCIAAGGSPDYAFGIGIPYVMTMELSGGCFHPPSSEILRIAQESWIGIRAMCDFIAKM